MRNKIKINCSDMTLDCMTQFYGKDWSNLDIYNWNFKDLRNVILPKDKDFFKKHSSKVIYNIKLPPIDLNFYDMTGITLNWVVFADGTIFPKDKDFFKRLGKGFFCNTHLPEWDYSIYDFTDLNINDVSFSKKS